jgi:hypothetical protein
MQLAETAGTAATEPWAPAVTPEDNMQFRSTHGLACLGSTWLKLPCDSYTNLMKLLTGDHQPWPLMVHIVQLFFR